MNPYEDIIDLEYPVPSARKKMSLHDRAAQFSPFAALTGYDDAIVETARLTDPRSELDEERIRQINEKLQYISENIRGRPEVEIVYFAADEKKDGGKYITVSGKIRNINEYESTLIFEDDRKVIIGDIFEIKICPIR